MQAETAGCSALLPPSIDPSVRYLLELKAAQDRLLHDESPARELAFGHHRACRPVQIPETIYPTMSSHSTPKDIFWPKTIRHAGFLYGWKLEDGTCCVAGVLNTLNVSSLGSRQLDPAPA